MRIDNLPILENPSNSVSVWIKKIVQYWNDQDQGVKIWTKLYVGNGPSSPCGDFFVNGSFGTTVKIVSTNYFIGSSDQIILANSTSSAFTITLPTASGITGKRYTVKDWEGTSAANNITIATVSSQTIDGTTLKLTTNYQAVELVSDGANWTIISNK